MIDKQTRSNLSEAVLRHVLARGFTQREIAGILSVTESYVSRVSSRQRALTIDQIEQLAQRLGIKVSTLFPGAPRSLKRKRPVRPGPGKA